MEKVEAIEFKILRKLAGVKQVSPLKINTSGYPFVTLYNSKGGHTNIYFSVKSSETVANTFAEGASVKDYLLTTSVIKTLNSNGEVRYKVTSPNNRESFDDEATTTDFDVQEFVKQFENTVVTAE